jgi:hypothetical protein
MLANLMLLTLVDDEGGARSSRLAPPAHEGRARKAAHTLEDITTPATRLAARELLEAFVGHQEQTRESAVRFGRTIPDLPDLVDKIRAVAVGCHVDVDVDEAAPAVVLVMEASGAASHRLLGLVAEWPEADAHPRTVSVRRHRGQSLIVTMDQSRASRFLAWIRDRP